MTEYIDRGMARVAAVSAFLSAKQDPSITTDMVRDCIDGLPAVDAVEVVRCLDCRFLGIKDFVYGYCENPCGLHGIVRPESYCSRGEREEDKP